MLRILALETSGSSGSVAALAGDELLQERVLDPALRSARSLAPGIRQLLLEVDWRPRDVQLVAVTAGPGSFTGLRVGIATAKAFAYAVGADILGIDTLEVLAEQSPPDAQVVHPAIDAQRQELFAATYRRASGSTSFNSPPAPQIVAIEDWLKSAQPFDTLIGPVLSKLRDRIPPHVQLAPEASWTPLASSVGRIAWRRYSSGQRHDLWQLVPLYLRRSAAEEKADARPPAS
jgi:tRNA threonylcarbamoyladenosine biosynthesis protein TsaB